MGEAAGGKIVYATFRFRMFLALLFVIFITLVSLGLAVTDPHPLLMLWLGALMFGALIPVCLVSLLRGVPRIEIARDGLAYVTAFRTRRWVWSEVGPFVVHEYHAGALSVQHLWACAFFESHHLALTSQKQKLIPDRDSADIKIPLKHTPAGRDRPAADVLVSQLNTYRARYGRTAVPPSPSTAARVLARLRRTVEVRTKGQWVAIGVLAVVVFVGHVFIFPYLVERFG